jgi:hypothetical protein
MATGTQSQRDVEYNQTFLNATGPSTSQSAGRGIQIAESDGRLSHGLSEQRVEVTVLRAVNIPLASIKKYPLFKRKLFVTVSNPETTAKTADVRVEGQMAKWNQNMDGFLVQPFSHLTLCLYAKGSAHPDILIGTHEMPIPLASQSGSFCWEFSPVQSIERLACRYPLCPREWHWGSYEVDPVGHFVHNSSRHTSEPAQQPNRT